MSCDGERWLLQPLTTTDHSTQNLTVPSTITAVLRQTATLSHKPFQHCPPHNNLPVLTATWGTQVCKSVGSKRHEEKNQKLREYPEKSQKGWVLITNTCSTFNDSDCGTRCNCYLKITFSLIIMITILHLGKQNSTWSQFIATGKHSKTSQQRHAITCIMKYCVR